MYILIKPEQLGGGNALRETLPDGRVILSLSDIKMMGSLSGVDIVATAREVKEIIRAQKESGKYPEEVIPEETIPDTPETPETDIPKEETTAPEETGTPEETAPEETGIPEGETTEETETATLKKKGK